MKAQFLVSILKITHMNCLDNTPQQKQPLKGHCLSKSFTLWSTGQPQTVKVEPLYWTYRAITGNHLSIISLATEVKHVISSKRSIFPCYAFQCDLHSCGVLLQQLSLHFLFFSWTDPRGVVATFQHLLQLRVFPLQVQVFLHQIDCNPSSKLSFDQCLSNDQVGA